MRAKYLFEWFPPIIEEEITEVTIKKKMNEFDADKLKDELGKMLFGDEYETNGIGNPELPSIYAGMLGGEVRKWKDTITSQTYKKEY